MLCTHISKFVGLIDRNRQKLETEERLPHNRIVVYDLLRFLPWQGLWRRLFRFEKKTIFLKERLKEQLLSHKIEKEKVDDKPNV